MITWRGCTLELFVEVFAWKFANEQTILNNDFPANHVKTSLETWAVLTAFHFCLRWRRIQESVAIINLSCLQRTWRFVKNQASWVSDDSWLELESNLSRMSDICLTWRTRYSVKIQKCDVAMISDLHIFATYCLWSWWWNKCCCHCLTALTLYQRLRQHQNLPLIYFDTRNLWYMDGDVDW